MNTYNLMAHVLSGLTPLMTACMYGKTAMAAYLLGMGAATRLSDINGDTALHWAAYKGHADLVRLLIYSGVPLHCTDNFGSTPLHLACLSGNLTCVRLLCEKVNILLFSDCTLTNFSCLMKLRLYYAVKYQVLILLIIYYDRLVWWFKLRSTNPAIASSNPARDKCLCDEYEYSCT